MQGLRVVLREKKPAHSEKPLRVEEHPSSRAGEGSGAAFASGLRRPSVPTPAGGS